MAKENYYWFSISTGGVNQGVFQTKAANPQEAEDKFEAATKDIRKGHVRCLEGTEQEPGIELDRLYTKKEMQELGYHSVSDKS